MVATPLLVDTILLWTRSLEREDWVLDFEDATLNLQQADPSTPQNWIDSKALARIP